MPFLIFVLDTCDFFNIDMFEILKESSEMIENCLFWVERQKNRRFSARSAVPPPILHSSILYLFKQLPCQFPNLRAVTFFLVEYL